MCLIGSDVYIFGGLVEGYVTTNDLWKISFLDGSAHWTKVRRRIASANPSRLKLVDYYRAQGIITPSMLSVTRLLSWEARTLS